MKENFKVCDKDTGKEYWISRASSVVACLVALDPNTRIYNFLVERRGPGCPDEVGKLAFPCGYLNWGENKVSALIREVREEIGLELDPDDVIEWCEIDDPDKDARENIVTRYIVPLDYDKVVEYLKTVNLKSEERGGEANEVDEVMLIPYTEVGNQEGWAFNHDGVIDELLSVLNEYAPKL